MLTGQQSRLLRFIESRLGEGDVSPSFEEMRLHMGLRSKSGVHRLVEGLRERGFVARLPQRARSLRLLREEDREEGSREGSIEDNRIRLPFLGSVACGLPIEAVGVGGWDEEQECPSELLGRGGMRDGSVRMAEHYALRVEGDSMVEAGILDGDTVIVEACEEAGDGELVIALVDGGDATLKILRKRGGEVVLQAANRAYEEQRYEAGRVRIQGRVTGLMRSYANR